MDVAEVKKSIKRIIDRHRDAFKVIGDSQTKLLELGAITGVAEHYRAKGYSPRVVNPAGKRSFVVKTSTRGFPWNFSKILIETDTQDILCELHMNVMVIGAHGIGTYCVDVGVIAPGSIPAAKPRNEWKALANKHMVTFAEVKKLVVYPMLLAQFVGIVHEIKPAFLKRRRRTTTPHPPPMLIALGHYSANSLEIVNSYASRGISLTIAANYDGRLARVRAGISASPFDDDDEDL